MEGFLARNLLKGGKDANKMTEKERNKIKLSLKRLKNGLKNKFSMKIKYNDLGLFQKYIKDYLYKNLNSKEMVYALYYLRELEEEQKNENKTKIIKILLNQHNLGEDNSKEINVDKKKIEYLQKHLPEMKVYDNCNIENYLEDEELGSGAYGSVFSIKNNPNVVVKTIDLTEYIIPNEINLFRYELDEIINEIMILKKLKGTKIAPEYYESWLCIKNDKLFVYIAEERMTSSYGDWIDSGNIISDETFIILKEKLNKLHKLNIVHLDFHSENVMLKITEEEGKTIVEPYINDFGLSKFSQSLIKEKQEQDLRAYERLRDEFSRYEREFYALFINYKDFSIIIN